MAGIDTSGTAAALIRDGSPLDWDTGTLGRATRVESTSLRNPDPGWAQRRAEELLDELRGLPRTLSVDCPPMPWLDPGDVVEVAVGGGVEQVVVAGWALSVSDAGVAFQLVAQGWSEASPVVPFGGDAAAAVPLALEAGARDVEAVS